MSVSNIHYFTGTDQSETQLTSDTPKTTIIEIAWNNQVIDTSKQLDKQFKTQIPAQARPKECPQTGISIMKYPVPKIKVKLKDSLTNKRHNIYK